MGRYAIVKDRQVVDGPVVWDGVSKWAPPPGTEVLELRAGVRCEVGYQIVDGVPVAPTPLLEDVRTETLRDIEKLGAVLAEADAFVPGYDSPLGIGESSRADWSSLLHVVNACSALGVDPDTAVFPRDFPARDGTMITLPRAQAAWQLYLALFNVGMQRRADLDTARAAVLKASSVAEIEEAAAVYQARTLAPRR